MTTRAALLLGMMLCAGLQAQAAPVVAVSAEPAPVEVDGPAPEALPVESIRLFADVFERVRQNYVEPVSDERLFDNAMSGLLARLDPYSEFLDAQSYNRILEFTEGELAQTGLGVRQVGEQWRIDRVDEQSPAARAGLVVGDVLLRLDSKTVRGMSQQDIEQRLRGSIGSSVQLGILSQGQHAREVKVLRGTPEHHAVVGHVEPDGIVVMAIQAFQSTTGQQLLDALEPVRQDGRLRGILLDLRDNPGGLLSSAVEIGDYFLDQGLIVSTRGRGEPEQRYQALSAQRFSGVPVVVLINRYSASAAEVLAGALQDQSRATIVGQPSYGKGSVQKLWPIGAGRAMKLTVARYYTPKGRMIEGQGIVPDVVIADSKPTDNDPMLLAALNGLREQIYPTPVVAPALPVTAPLPVARSPH
jgi:carboxyl-terminal processing protease